MLKYLAPFMLSFLLSVFFLALAVYFGKKFNWQGRRAKRHIHEKGVLRIGGAVLIPVFNLSILLNRDLFISSEVYGLMAASLILLAIGLWDDIKEIYWKIQLFFQIAVSTLVFISGIRIYYVTNPLTGGIFKLDSSFWVLASIVLVIFWIVLIINAINWIDGIDGLSGGIVLIAAAVIFSLSLKSEVNQPPVAILGSIFIGTVLGFLIFNFYPAKIIAGTSGAMFMGFVLAVLAIIAGTKIATAVLVLAVPIIDFLWVIGERIKNGRSIFKPDKRHLHYKLLKLGWTQKEVVFGYWIVTFAIGIVALNTRVMGKLITLAISASIMLIVLILINRKISARSALKK